LKYDPDCANDHSDGDITENMMCAADGSKSFNLFGTYCSNESTLAFLNSFLYHQKQLGILVRVVSIFHCDDF